MIDIYKNMNKNNINQDSLDFEFPISLGEF